MQNDGLRPGPEVRLNRRSCIASLFLKVGKRDKSAKYNSGYIFCRNYCSAGLSSGFNGKHVVCNHADRPRLRRFDLLPAAEPSD